MKSTLFYLAGAFVLGANLWAVPNKFDLYSWEKGAKDWCFSLLPQSKETVEASAIRNAKDQACGRHDVKRLMGMVLPVGAQVRWKTDEANGFTLPQKDIVNDLVRFAEVMDYKILLPKGDTKRGNAWE